MLSVAGTKSKAKGSQSQFPITQNMTVVEGTAVNMTCRVEFNDNTSLQWSNPAQQTLFFGDTKALRDNRIELVRATSQELTIRISDVSLSDEGLYTCSLFTMPVKTTKAYLTVLGSKEVNATGRSFTVKSSLQFQVDRRDDSVAYTCSVEHVSLTNPYMTTEVLEVHYAPHLEIRNSLIIPQEGQYFKLECVNRGNPIPEPILWSKDGGELPDVERMIVEGTELTFTMLNKTDNGTYRCEASNDLGTARAEYILFVYDPNALGQHGPDHALIGGVVAVVVFITLCLIIVLGRYLARHKGTYLTHEAKGAEDAPDADTAIINAEGNHVHAEEKKEYFI
ncbi:hypothetical protein WMY93_029126 [Mugilogobius chulae]|uniref:Ig-like domain-containing protein n=1 Tax=Mugilogobius chulae TaxID=88201 RepID=A0AAW0MQA4_9GOBI